MGTIYHKAVKDKTTASELTPAGVYYSTSFASLAEAVNSIGSEVADLIIVTPNFPDGDAVVVPVTLRLLRQGAGSIFLSSP